MKAYEYYADVLTDGHLSIPKDLKDKLKPESKVRVMLYLMTRIPHGIILPCHNF